MTIKKFFLAPDAFVAEIDNGSLRVSLYTSKNNSVQIISELTVPEMDWMTKFLNRETVSNFNENMYTLPEKEYAVLKMLLDESNKEVRSMVIDNEKSTPYDSADKLLDLMRNTFTTFKLLEYGHE